MRVSRRLLVVGMAWLLSACAQTSTETCADGRVCPADTQCDQLHRACVTDEQLTVCGGAPDLVPCTYGDGEDGTCRDQICLPSDCGNGVLDADEECDDGAENADVPDARCRLDCQFRRCGDGVIDAVAGEVCDDSNVIDQDGCSFDCRSTQVCANGIVDVAVGETCDDGDTQVFDGCDTTCQAEQARWTLASSASVPYSPPSARFDMALAYDPAHGQVVLFGGRTPSTAAAATYVYDGTVWTWMRDSADPPARYGHAMVGDVARGQLVLFGGAGPLGIANDTWVWTGAT